jgi:hypothetical protein
MQQLISQFRSWRYPQSLMDAPEIVMQEVYDHGVLNIVPADGLFGVFREYGTGLFFDSLLKIPPAYLSPPGGMRYRRLWIP